MTRATQYIVIGKHDSERNSWIEGGDIRHVCSGHNTERAAWVACEHAHRGLGGCEGSDMLSSVMARYARLGSRKARDYIADSEDGENPSYADYYKHAGWLYVPCDWWSAHQIIVTPGGLGYTVRTD